MISMLWILLFNLAWSAELPLTQEKWVSLSFSKIPKNHVQFNDGEMRVSVDQSAGPLVQKLEAPLKVSSFKVKGELKGLKKVETGAFDEDSVLRIGLVAVGERTLNAVKRVFAADWIKKLFALAPPKTGLDKIYFFNLTNRPELVGKKREHPKSDLMLENVFHSLVGEGAFEAEFKLEAPLEVAALWLSVDGDDTKSKFDLTIRQILIQASE